MFHVSYKVDGYYKRESFENHRAARDAALAVMLSGNTNVRIREA